MRLPIQAFLSELSSDVREIVDELRILIRETCPELVEDLADGQLLYALGGPVCVVRPREGWVDLGVVRGPELAGLPSFLAPGKAALGWVRIHDVEDLWPGLLRALLRDAIALQRPAYGSALTSAA